MAIKKIVMTLKYDDNDDPRIEEVVRESVKMAAKQALTTVMLVSPRRKPDVAIESDDWFCGKEQIDLADDIPPDLATLMSRAEPLEESGDIAG